MVLFLNFLDLGSVSGRVQSIKLADGTGNGSVSIGGVDLKLFFIEFRVQKIKILNVVLSEFFS